MCIVVDWMNNKQPVMVFHITVVVGTPYEHIVDIVRSLQYGAR